jgi:CubicO group peptidase (beta-lactamase class C family)
MRMKRLLGLGVVLLSCSGRREEARWPTRGWTTSTPEAEGLDGSALADLDREFASGSHGYVDGMLVVRNGRLVFEKSYAHDYQKLFEGRQEARGPYNYYDPDWHPYYQKGELHTMQSVSKSVTSALVGIAIGRGEMPGLDAKVLSYFEGFQIPDPDSRKQAITLRHLLTMTPGFLWDESTVSYTDPANHCARMEQSEDWVQFVLEQEMAEEPGRVFVYNSGATQLLSYLLKKTTGKEADDYAAEHLFGPLGIERYYWKRTPKGLADTEGGLYLTARDLAKIGYLYLKDGVWEGRRILPEGWVKATMAPSADPRIASAPDRRYGYQWWLLPHSGSAFAYAALGYGGQRLIVVPEHELIAVFTGWNIYEKPALDPGLALERVLRAVKR